jgi:dynein heavy chain, axonemal
LDGGISRDDFIDNVAADILNKMPKAFDISLIKRTFQMNVTPISVVLLQELERFNHLVQRIESSLQLLRKALAGEIGMDTTLDGIAQALFNGQLPDNWRKLAPRTRKQLGDWMDHFQKRSQQYKFWAVSGEPLVMWLSGLHIPESYLTALVQVFTKFCNLLGKIIIFPIFKCRLHVVKIIGLWINQRCIHK